MSKILPRSMVIEQGQGMIECAVVGDTAALTRFHSRYPLKLIRPSAHMKKTALVYALTYGGGLVCGDVVTMNIAVRKSAKLAMLTQGSTKVFKKRNPNLPLSTAASAQHFKYTIEDDGLLVLLPDQVTCFKDAMYHQTQDFQISGTGSLVLGRMSRGESWEFAEYNSVNNIFHDGKLVLRDAQVIRDDHRVKELEGGEIRSAEDKQAMNHFGQRTNYGYRVAPYECYAILVIYGPHLKELTKSILEEFNRISISPRSSKLPPQSPIWSASVIGNDDGVILRAAALTTEEIRLFVKEHLKEIVPIIGDDVYSRMLI
ncbi:UreD-domain-containing protein [Basidiobolus meristosporus CBS 931.73]|uniref:UreD-domain-containing protein n=1 Tax=Basidiobolus meristosporus CBS 931.73 TaxID=1314790 RepID=A0A1Y1XE13_9FUNG|nr:UreD-domain-containing protein [Basidiobolus meristosporus CBS 931.73]|eukprot:ORX83998.1 UreD-domain-containing protein [Basidiobolus meristosporus CBS 931.73]